ncbi:hypothetical protein [Winogradskyella sp.]|uniref:hypothetical protein n=1 Tax=Winogradskyella sp. TaxID=1883156 RepID=UPI003BA8C238
MFNLFRKKNKTTINSKIRIEKTTDGFVGDFWNGYLGFEEHGANNFAQELTACTMEYGHIISSNASIIVSRLDGSHSSIFMYSKNESILSAYPILKSKNSISFQTIKIIEWEHMENLEAQIEGRGENKFGISFFADDYVLNKRKYQENENLRVVLTGFVITAEIFQPSEGFADNFVAYMPNSEYGKYSVMDYVGEVKNVSFVNEDIYGINIEGYVMTLILVRSEEENVYFELDVFLNKNNTELNDIKVGDKLSGMIKLSGRIE